MIRYYVSFAHQSDEGIGVITFEYPAPAAICTLNDIEVITDHLRSEGYRKPIVLAFSTFTDTCTSADASKAATS